MLHFNSQTNSQVRRSYNPNYCQQTSGADLSIRVPEENIMMRLASKLASISKPARARALPI